MKPLIALLAASTLFGGCACTEANLVGITARVDGGSTAEAGPETTVDGRVAGGWFMHPGGDPSVMCDGLGDEVLPCRDVLAVCVVDANGDTQPKWLGQAVRCTDGSPTWRDVCRTRPEDEWAFYGYTREECADA